MYKITRGQLVTIWVFTTLLWIWAAIKSLDSSYYGNSLVVTLAQILFFALPAALIFYSLGWRKVNGTFVKQRSVTGRSATANKDWGPLDIREFYVVPVGKFFLLAILTFGLYPIFWFAKNWMMIKDQEKSTIWPIARAIFGVFYFPVLAYRVLRSAKARGYEKSYYPGLLGLIYFFLHFFSGVAGVFSLIVVLLPFIPVLKAILYNNEKSNKRLTDIHSYSAGEVIALIIGGLLWAMVIITSLLPGTN